MNLFTDERTKRFTVGLRDVVFSLYYTIGGAVGTAMITALDAHKMPSTDQIKVAIGAGFFVGLQHIVRKYLTGPVSGGK